MALNDSFEMEVYKIQPEDLEPTTNEACTEFQFKAIELRKQKPQWISYQKSEMLDREDYDLITRFDSNPAERLNMLNNPNERIQCIKTLITIMNKLTKEITIQYVLTLMDDILQESKHRVELFHAYARRYNENIYSTFQKMLYNHDYFITNQTSRIISKLACWSNSLMNEKDLRDYFVWIQDQLDEKNPFKETLCRCLQMMLRIDAYRDTFYRLDGVSKLTRFLENTLQKQGKDQIQYQIIFCIWQLTFNGDIASKIESTYLIIPLLADILNASEKEKVKRVILALFRNLLEKPISTEITRANALCMLQFKVKKLIEIMQTTQIADEEIRDDTEYLSKKLELLVNDVSSFDEYAAEVASGRLSWSPVHKSDKFWRENAARLNENNFYLVKQLINLLKDESTIVRTLEVAAYDLGEYVRYYNRGKVVVEQFDGKSAVMTLLSHPETNVRHQALLCVQKLMVHNWEYLSKSDMSNQAQSNNGGKIVESKA